MFGHPWALGPAIVITTGPGDNPRGPRRPYRSRSLAPVRRVAAEVGLDPAVAIRAASAISAAGVRRTVLAITPDSPMRPGLRTPAPHELIGAVAVLRASDIAPIGGRVVGASGSQYGSDDAAPISGM